MTGLLEQIRYRRAVRRRLAAIPAVPDPAEEVVLEQPGLTADAVAAVTYWRSHSRACRRALVEAGIGPTDVRHLHGCACDGPARDWDLASLLVRGVR